MGSEAFQHLVIVYVIAGATLLFLTATIERGTGKVETRRDTIDITHLGYLMLVLAGLFQIIVFNVPSDHHKLEI